jgi:uncharacterized membrane protein YdfJ with MMPL/SSD domain
VTERLAISSARHPWRTIAAWLVVIVLSFGVIATLYGDALSGDPDVTSETDSKRAEALLEEHFPRDRASVAEEISEVAVIRVQPDAVEQAGAELADAILAAGATQVVTPQDDPELLSADRDSVALLIALGPDPEDTVGSVMEAVERLDDRAGVEAGVTGEFSAEEDFGTLAQDDLRTGELFFGAPVALFVLLLVFGAVVAGVVPLVLALVAIFVALALTGLVGAIWPFSEFVQNMIFGMGLALGIDYALFIVSRFREGRSGGREKFDAIATAGSTASRAVLFSGMAFVLAMTGLLLVPNTIMRSLAGGAILVGLTSMAAALTLLPAFLGLLGDRVNSLRLPYFGRAAEAGAARGSPFWDRVVCGVIKRPALSLAAATGLLVAATIPVLSIETGTAGITTLPDRFTSKQGFVLLNEEFPGRTTDPVVIAIQGDASSQEVQTAIGDLEAALSERQIFGPPEEEVSESGELTSLTVPVAGDSVSPEAVQAVRDLRSDVIPRALGGGPAQAYVTGDTAEEIDYFDVMDKWRLPVFAFVLGLSFILLTIAFRSIVLPAKAIVLNLLSVGAAYGLLVLVFVKGFGNEIFGFQQVDTVEAWVPLFLFAVLFGLSMDYQVFLLSRIRERYTQSGDTVDAVRFGVGSTARIITGAALIIVAVFAGFAAGDLVMFQQMGFGIAIALLIDATIVRSVLVPAAMTLLGKWNWYLPSWLEWLPHVEIEGEAAPEARAAPQSAR